MKLKAVITEGKRNAKIIEAFGSEKFAKTFLNSVCLSLGVTTPSTRPAEYYVQKPDKSICIDFCYGVELRLTGISRANRSAKQFHDTLKKMHKIAKNTIKGAIEVGKIQLFCVIMLDGDIETKPGSGEYSNILESKPEWIEARK